MARTSMPSTAAGMVEVTTLSPTSTPVLTSTISFDVERAIVAEELAMALGSALNQNVGEAIMIDVSSDDSILPFSQTDPTHISTFAYPYGEGWVIYSTILLDFYLAGGGSVPAVTNIYAPNIVDYGAFLVHEGP